MTFVDTIGFLVGVLPARKLGMHHLINSPHSHESSKVTSAVNPKVSIQDLDDPNGVLRIRQMFSATSGHGLEGRLIAAVSQIGRSLEGKTRLESRDHVATDPFKDR